VKKLTPDVSILLPVRLWRDTTSAAVSSLLAQTHQSLEILVIGHDDVGYLVKQLPPDPRIKAISRTAPGIVGALNTGLSQACGTYIARMDDDDIAYPKRIETQLDFLNTHRHVQLCAARIRFIHRDGRTDTIGAGNQHYGAWLNALTDHQDISNAWLTECPMPHPTLLAHRDVWHKLGGYRQFDGPEDYDLILRARLLGVVMGKPLPILQDWREHDQRLTYRDSRYRREAFTRCRAWAATQQSSTLRLLDGRGVWICGTGRSARYWHDALEDNAVKVHGFVDRLSSSARRQKRHKPVISYEQLPVERGDSLVITALSQPQTRKELHRYFNKQGWRNGVDYVMGG